MVRDDCERKIAEAKAEAEMRAATAEEAAAAATMRAIDIETANAEKRIAEVRAALADRHLGGRGVRREARKNA